MESSGMRRLRSVDDTEVQELPLNKGRFTVPPPTSYIARKRSNPFMSELEAVDGDLALPPPALPEELLGNTDESAARPTTPPTRQSVEMLESETRLRVADVVSTPPVRSTPKRYDIPEIPVGPWEKAIDDCLKLFGDLRIDLRPLAEYYEDQIQAHEDLYYDHSVLLNMMMLRDATKMMQEYFMEGVRPNPHEPLGDFFGEQLNNAKLRESIRPSEDSIDAIIKDSSYDTFQQIRMVMRQPMEELEEIVGDHYHLNMLFRMVVLSWQLEKLER